MSEDEKNFRLAVLPLRGRSFQEFDLQGSHRCSSDWMSISSYRSLDGLRVCGSSLPPPYISSQDHIWIHFHSDDSLTGKGFRLSYITGEDDAGPQRAPPCVLGACDDQRC